MTEVNFRLDGSWYAVRFDYDRDLVGLIKRLPSFARGWKPELKCWRVDPYYARVLAIQLENYGYTVTGLDPEDYRTRTRDRHDGAGTDWAALLFKQVGPDRADVVFRALTRILHPDNQDTGDPKLQRELNDARAEMEKS